MSKSEQAGGVTPDREISALRNEVAELKAATKRAQGFDESIRINNRSSLDRIEVLREVAQVLESRPDLFARGDFNGRLFEVREKHLLLRISQDEDDGNRCLSILVTNWFWC